METNKLTVQALMVGDWVKIKEPNKYAGAIGTIQSLSSLEGAYFAIYINDPNFGTFITEVFCEDIEPIPLTAEILEKNGFSELMEHDEWSRIFRAYHDDLFIEVGIYEPMFINIGYVDKEGEEQPLCNIVKIHGENFFVHDLQHALRLCGVDKEITP